MMTPKAQRPATQAEIETSDREWVEREAAADAADPSNVPPEEVVEPEVEKVVRYTGTADARILLVSDLEKVLVPRHGREVRQMVWNKDNDYTVPAADLDFLDPEEFARVIAADRNLVVEEVRDDTRGTLPE